MNLTVSERHSRPGAREAGFTITEILVVITIGSLVIGFALSLFLFVARLASGWQKETELKDQVRGVARAVMRDMDRALRAEPVNDSTWVITLPGDRSVTYRAWAGAVYRNDARLVSDKDVFIRLSVSSSPSRGARSQVEDTFIIVAEGSRRGRIERASTAVALARSSKLEFSSRSL